MNKILTAETAELIADPARGKQAAWRQTGNRKEIRQLLALRHSSAGSLHRFASSQRTLRLNLSVSKFLN
jgi:hypothetical protein